MEQPAGNGLSVGRVLATIAGVLLLAPGTCGLLFSGGAWLEHLSRGTARFSDYEEIVWVLAQPGVMAGCLGLFVLAKSVGRPGYIKAARVGGWFALGFTLVVCAFVIYASSLRSRGMGEGLSMSGIFLIAFAIGGLPALIWLRAPAPSHGDQA
ncbi:MAG: hypothetical protein KDJ73_03975 [Notoacmeibacter sp.]|nr:hypothetical protein [Notoacmeibacter sp.]